VFLVAFVLTLLIFETDYFVRDVLSKNSGSVGADQLVVDTKAIDGAEPEKTYLSPKGEGEGFGLARRLYSDGHYIHTVDATLPILEDNEKYLGWLADSEDYKYLQATGEFIPLNQEYFLVYQNTNSMPEYTYVVITKSKGDDNFDPNTVVLSGKF